MNYLKTKNTKKNDLSKEIAYHEISTMMILKSVLEIAEEIIKSNNFEERNDRKWVFASASQATSYLDYKDKFSEYFDKFEKLCDNSWDIDTFNKNKLRK
jgi:hypothetical protein